MHHVNKMYNLIRFLHYNFPSVPYAILKSLKVKICVKFRVWYKQSEKII